MNCIARLLSLQFRLLLVLLLMLLTNLYEQFDIILLLDIMLYMIVIVLYM